GEVPGHPLNQFSLDESDGHLRIATTSQPFWGGPIPLAVRGGGAEQIAVAVDEAPASTAEPSAFQSSPTVAETVPAAVREPQGPTNNVYVLNAADLSITGSLEGLAPGERIYAARFIEDRAYLVTFVQIDPLFVIDLSDPAAPKLLGELKIPGYSDYLHPLDDSHLIGIGKEATPVDEGGRAFAFPEGLKVAIFDVTDVANPRVASSMTLGAAGSNSEALQDHHAFLFDPERQLLVLPAQLTKLPEGASGPHVYGEPDWQGALVFRATADSLELRGRVTHDSASAEKPDYWYWSGGTAIRRSLTIGDTLYTVSSSLVKASALSDLSELSSVPLPAAPETPPYQVQKGAIAE
ncbi:MAG TPA: beta-propeller domain-containing protein, partial [archaeon]|nr:beta-propeller domain-containing protein [archaeon]